MRYILVTILFAGLALANCEVECPEGQNKVTFADGNNTRCVCVDPSSGMQESPSGCGSEECQQDPYEHVPEE